MKRLFIAIIAIQSSLLFGSQADAQHVRATSPWHQSVRFELGALDVSGGCSLSVNHYTVQQLIPRLAADGIPDGIEWITPDDGHQTMHVKGTPEAIQNLAKQIADIDKPKDPIRIQLMDVYAPFKTLAALGVEAANPNEAVHCLVARKEILQAVADGTLQASNGPVITLNDGDETTVVRNRAPLCPQEKFWSPRLIPSNLRMRLKLQARITEPGKVSVDMSQGITALYPDDSQCFSSDDSTQEGDWAELENGKLTLLSAMSEEVCACQTANPQIAPEGIVHLVLATATFHVPDGSPTPTHADEATVDMQNVDSSIQYADAPASVWRALDIDVHATHWAPIKTSVVFQGFYQAGVHIHQMGQNIGLWNGEVQSTLQTETLPPGSPATKTLITMLGSRIGYSQIRYKFTCRDLQPSHDGITAPSQTVSGLTDSGSTVILSARPVPGHKNSLIRVTFMPLAIPNLGNGLRSAMNH